MEITKIRNGFQFICGSEMQSHPKMSGKHVLLSEYLGNNNANHQYYEKKNGLRTLSKMNCTANQINNSRFKMVFCCQLKPK